MQITVTFDSLDEMREFTEKIMVGGVLAPQQGAMEQPKAEAPAEQPVAATPAAPITPVAPTAVPTAVPTMVPTAAQTVATQPATPAPVASQTAPAQVTPVPTSAVTYTPDDLARAAMALMDSGKQQELIALLGQFGVVAIPELRPEQYGAFATALRGMGAQI